MLALPVAIGWILRLKAGSALNPHLFAIALCWFSGYFAFNAVTLLFKRRPGRRRPAFIALAVWSSLALTFGATAVVLAGSGVAAWALVFAPLLVAALWLSAIGRERSVASGALTVGAAAVMTLVSRFGTLPDFLAALGTPTAITAELHTGLVFGYLFGTVLHVKTMIRERGKPAWLIASVAWQAAVTLTVGVLASRGVLSWTWVPLFGLASFRSLALPWLGARQRVRPLFVGLVEIGICGAFVSLTALS